jgi:hypothetical protein
MVSEVFWYIEGEELIPGRTRHGMKRVLIY